MELGWKIDEIVHAEVWATDDISADLPPMVEFKKKADKIIKDRWGIEVKHLCAMRGGSGTATKNTSTTSSEQENLKEKLKGSQCNGILGVNNLKLDTEQKSQKATYENIFYSTFQKGNKIGRIYGFPMQLGAWCNSRLKMPPLNFQKHESEVVQYLGIAADEPKRIYRHKSKKGILLPLVEIGWTEADAKEWCIENDLLSPIYTDSCLRGGCWFCHNQGIDQLRQLRHNYPEYWELLLKWDKDSPVSFKADGRNVHDFERRFKAEDEGFIKKEDRFRWNDLDMQQYNIFQFMRTTV